MNTKHSELIDDSTQMSVQCISVLNNANISVALSANDSVYNELLAKYPKLIKNDNFSAVPNHSVQHFIETHGPPVHAKARRLAPDKLKIAKAEFEHMLELGIIQSSNSPWASPLHMVSKSNNEWRPCGDYRLLNAKTVPDRYNLPNINDFSANLFGKKFFSEIDLKKAFYQIPMSPQDIAKTAVITPFGSFQFLKMPFGLRNSAQTFQRFIDQVLRGLDFCFPFVDNILVFSESEAEHLQHLKCVFHKLQENSVIVNTYKCKLGRKELDFLGYTINCKGIFPNKTKIDTITQFPLPNTQRQLREFLGMINFYRKFIPSCGPILQPLHALLKGPK